MAGTIAVVGGTGNVGRRLVARLAGAGRTVRAISRTGPDVPEEVESVAADLTDPTAASRALEGADAVYLTPPIVGDTPLETERAVCHNIIEAAQQHGVDHLVMHTALQADRGDTGVRLLDNKAEIEAELAASGVPYTVLRPPWFFQNLWGAREYITEHGVLSFPWDEDNRWAAIDVEDIAAAAAHVLATGPRKRGIDLSVPGGITARQIIDAASTTLGRDLSYVQAGSAAEWVAGFPVPDAVKSVFAELFDHFRESSYLTDTDDMRRELDEPSMRGIETFVREELLAGA